MAVANFPMHGSSGDKPDDKLNEHVHEPGDPDGIVAAEEQRCWQETHPMLPPTPHAEYRSRRRWPALLAVVVILALAAAGSFWFGSREAVKQQDARKPQHINSRQRTNLVGSGTAQTKHYDSSNYTLSFYYPAAWTVSDTSTKLTVTSPATWLKSAADASVDVHAVVVIQNQQTSMPGFPSGGAVAALESDKLTYKQPSSIQRAQTYLSYLSYTRPDDLDALYVTGDNGYQQGQAIPMADVLEGNPLISVDFERCSNSTCTGSTNGPVTLRASDWQATKVSKEVVSLIEAIVLES